jgi:probable addiction module antidote protein
MVAINPHKIETLKKRRNYKNLFKLLEKKMTEQMTELKFTTFDLANHIHDKEDALFYLNDALETGDFKQILLVLNCIARAKNMTKIAQETGITREALYTALSQKGNPRLETFFNLLKALDITLTPSLKVQSSN